MQILFTPLIAFLIFLAFDHFDRFAGKKTGRAIQV